MNIEKKKLSELIRADYNPRIDLKKGDKVYEQLKRSIDEFGMVQPIVWNKTTGNIVGGHQRLTVLEDNGVEEVEVVVVELSEAEEKALNISLNKISGEWDFAGLANLLQELKEAETFALTGFSISEFETLINEAEEAVEIDEDYGEDESGPEEDYEESEDDINARIGEFIFKIPYADFEKVMAKIHQEYGYEQSNVKLALGRRIFGDEYSAM